MPRFFGFFDGALVFGFFCAQPLLAPDLVGPAALLQAAAQQRLRATGLERALADRQANRAPEQLRVGELLTGARGAIDRRRSRAPGHDPFSPPDDRRASAR